MKRTRIGLGLLVACTLALGACGGDDLKSDGDGVTPTQAGSDTSGGDGDGSGSVATIPDDVVPGLTDDCRELYNAFITAMGSVGGVGDAAEVTKTFDALVQVVPDDLKDDAKLLGQAYASYAELIKKYDGDITKAPVDELQAAMEAMNADGVSEAGDNISKYFDETCPSG